MSKSDPIVSPKTLKVDISLILSKPTTQEMIAAQVQAQISSSRIVCVIDGCDLAWYDRKEELPDTLLFEHKQTNKKTRLSEFYYRCTVSGSLYAFFLTEIHDYLKSQEEKSCIGKTVPIRQPKSTSRIRAEVVETV